jgi:hypothetical protein
MIKTDADLSIPEGHKVSRYTSKSSRYHPAQKPEISLASYECCFVIYFALILLNFKSIQEDIPLNNRFYSNT